MGKIKIRHNSMVIEKLNEIQNLRNKNNYQKMDNVEIMKMVVKNRFGEFMPYDKIDVVCMCNLLTQYKNKLQSELNLK